jgi:Helix-turn-helix domain
VIHLTRFHFGSKPCPPKDRANLCPITRIQIWSKTMSSQPSTDAIPESSRDLSDVIVVPSTHGPRGQTTHHDDSRPTTTIRPFGQSARPTAESDLELFVDARTAGKFLSLHPATIQRLARQGVLPAHPVNGRARKQWRFLLSELQDWLRARTSVPKSA